jgi:hypothetical protein
VTDVDVRPLNSSFEEAIQDVIQFVGQDRETFPFVFVDPTGWTGFSIECIAPLLKLQPCEVLVNFMLDFIRRFIEEKFTREGFARLFGGDDFDEGLRDLRGLDRDDAIADRYCHSLHEVCGFDHVQRAIVIHPDKDQSEFVLIYGTRHPKGIEVFKDVEQQAMEAQEQSRARVESDRRIKRERGQMSFLSSDDAPESRYYIGLRDRYLQKSRAAVVAMINGSKVVGYDELWSVALTLPLVWKSDLDGWLQGWCDNGVLEWQGRKPSERTLKRGKRHRLMRAAESVS